MTDLTDQIPIENADLVTPGGDARLLLTTGSGDNTALKKAGLNELLTGLLGDATRQAEIAGVLENLRGYLTDQQIHRLITDNASPSAQSPALTALLAALTETQSTDLRWRDQHQFADNNSRLLGGYLIGEARYTGNNEITTTAGALRTKALDIPRYSLYYRNGNNPLNFKFAGRRSQLGGIPLNIYGAAFAQPPPALTVMFDYILPTRQLNDDETIPLLKFGDNPAAIGLNGRVGAFVNRAEFVPASQTFTTVNKLFLPTNVAAASYRIAVSAADAAAGGVAFDQFYFYVQDGLPQNAQIKINLTAFPGTSGAQTITHNAIITNWDADEEISSSLTLQFSAGGDGVTPPPVTLAVRYIADHDGAHAIHISTVGAVQTVTPYDLSVGYQFSKQVNRPSEERYGMVRIPAADDHDTNGLGNELRDPELQLDTGITIIAQFIQALDGFIHVRVVVNGVAQNGGAYINTQRTAENMGLDDFRTNAVGGGVIIGDALTRISRVYIVGSDKALSAPQLLQLHTQRATPGIGFYRLGAPAPEFNIAARLRVKDSDGASFAVARPGLTLLTDAQGRPKNFLPTPIISTDTHLNANRREIPEMETAKAIAVVGAWEGAPLFSASSPQERLVGYYANEAVTIVFKTSYSQIISNDIENELFYNQYVIVGAHGQNTGQRYYFSITGRFIRLTFVRIAGGNPGIYAVYIFN